MVDAVGTTHHVKLNGQHFLVYPNSYFKRAAPAFGARFAGGDPDYSQLNFWQHWGQSCWIGGFNQDAWEDDAMYDYAVGVDSTQHDVLALSRGLVPGGTGFALGGDTDAERKFVVFKGTLYCFDYAYQGNTAVMYKYTDATDTWSTQRSFTDLRVGAMARFAKDLYVGTSGGKLRKWKTGTSWKQINKPKNNNDLPRMMHVYRGRLYVGFGNQLWRLKPNDKWDGKQAFFKGSGVDDYIDGALHQGFLYFASRNGHILRTDGNQTFDLYRFGGQTRIQKIISYDGKLFIFTREWYDDSTTGEAVIYQMSGAAVTELQRFGRAGITTQTAGAHVVARRLFYGASSLLGLSANTGMGIAVYDAREDSHSMFAAQRDTTTYTTSAYGRDYIIDDMIYWGNKFFVHSRGHGVFAATHTHRDLDRETAVFDNSWTGSIAAGNDEGGVLVSSDFDAGTPGLEKIWRKVDVTADMPSSACTVHLGYSLDGGKTWTDAGSFTKPAGGTRTTQSFYLNDVKSERFKYKLQLDTSDTDYSPFIRSVIASFLPNPEPNWMWQMTLVLDVKQTLLDGSTVDNDVDAIRASLESAFRDSQLVTFTDIDGTVWSDAEATKGVLIQDITFSAPFIGPSSDGDLEYTVQVQLLEAAETGA